MLLDVIVPPWEKLGEHPILVCVISAIIIAVSVFITIKFINKKKDKNEKDIK